MTLHETKNHDTTSAQTPEQHHVQAAEHLEHAAKCHKDAARMMGSGDAKGAQASAERAKTHAAQAAEHVTAASKKSTSPAKAHA